MTTRRLPDQARRGYESLRQSRGPTLLAAIGAIAFVVLGVLVATLTTQGLDVAVRNHLRPNDEWGPVQMRVDVIVEGLKPPKVAVLLAVLGIGASLWRSSWRPALFTALVAGAAGALTLAAKFALKRTDPHHDMTATGGSFPSGHTVSVIVLFGIAVLVLRSRSRWWDWVLVTVAGAAMAFSLVVQAAHWLTDVVGGALLAATVLATASMSALREPPRHRPRARATRSRGRVEQLGGEGP